MNKCEISVGGMTCSACAIHVEDAVKKINGVQSVSVNLLTNKAKITFDESCCQTSQFFSAIEKAGYKVLTQNSHDSLDSDKNLMSDEKETQNRLFISVGFLIPLFLMAMLPMIGVPIPFAHQREGIFAYAFTQFLLTLPILFANRSYFSTGFKTLFVGKPVMDSLIAVGAGAAILYSIYALYQIGYALGVENWERAHHYSMQLYFESASMILTLVLVGKYLEKRARQKTSSVIAKLINLTPPTVTRLREGKEEIILADQIQKGDLLLLKAGETAAVDGVVVEGYSSVNEAALTGESLPVEKEVGDRILAGSINKMGILKIEAQQIGAETTLSQIVRLVEEASGSKAAIARLADKLSRYFVPIVMCLSLLTFFLSLFAFEVGFEVAFSRAIAVLVISCPCALGLATPTAIMAGIGRGAELGILIRNGEALERAGRVNTLLLDKTGTLTVGHPTIVKALPAEGNTLSQLLTLALSLEKNSSHPLAEAVTAFALEKNISPNPVGHLQAVPGRGIIGLWNEKKALAGNAAFMTENAIALPPEHLPTGNETPLYFAVEDRFQGSLWATDALKIDSKEAIAHLKTMGIQPIMLTGDQKEAAALIAESVGINQFHAHLLPQDKEAFARQLQQSGNFVGMVGDGINDAPVLARADVSIAIGGGADIAVEAADIILMKNSLLDGVNALRLSRSVMKNIKQNLFWALFYNCLGIPAAAGVLDVLWGISLNPMFAAAAMSLSSLCVVGNALRLRAFRPLKSNSEGVTAEAPTPKKEEKMNTITLKIEGMMCNHCRNRVEEALNAVSGTKATVNLSQESAHCEIDKTVSLEQLIQAVKDAGYKVTSTN